MNTPTCPHCDHAMTTEEMLACKTVDLVDLFALAPKEEIATINCPACYKDFAVAGGYIPTYACAFTEDEL